MSSDEKLIAGPDDQQSVLIDAKSASTSADTKCVSMLAKIREIGRSFGLTSLERQLRASERLASVSHQAVRVAVLGRFKAGKSTFLNTLLGQPLLPTGVVPLTAVITIARYHPQLSCRVTFLDDRKETIEPSTIGLYVTEKENPDNIRSVSTVELLLPQLRDYAGLEFVDTPGIGSALLHNTEAAQAWLPEVGVAILAVSVDAPLSEQDIGLLNQLSCFTSRICVLLTKVDLLTEDQLTEVHQFIKNQIPKQLSGVEIFRFSAVATNASSMGDAKGITNTAPSVTANGSTSTSASASASTSANANGTTNYKKQLDQNLLYPLAKNHSQHNQSILHRKIRNLITESTEYLKIARQVSAVEESKRAELYGQILGEKNKNNLLVEEIHLLLNSLTAETRSTIEKRFAKAQDQITGKTKIRMQTLLTSSQQNLWHLTRSYEDFMEELTREEMNWISEMEFPFLVDVLNLAEVKFSRVVHGFHNGIATNVEKVLGTRLSPANFQLEIEPPQKPDVSLSRSFDHHVDLLWFLIPMSIFKPIFVRHFVNQIPREIEKNISRLASQWTDIVNGKMREMAERTTAHCRAEIATIEGLLNQTPSNDHVIESALKDLKSLENELPPEDAGVSSV